MHILLRLFTPARIYWHYHTMTCYVLYIRVTLPVAIWFPIGIWECEYRRTLACMLKLVIRTLSKHNTNEYLANVWDVKPQLVWKCNDNEWTHYIWVYRTTKMLHQWSRNNKLKQTNRVKPVLEEEKRAAKSHFSILEIWRARPSRNAWKIPN